MRIILDTRKSIEQNAALYFEKAKKARRKADGARKVLERARTQMLAQLDESESSVSQAPSVPIRKKEWYEHFRWFLTSAGFLCIGGRDATTNETVVKKHATEHDWILHTDMAGSPFMLVQTQGKEVPESDLAEVAQFSATYSRAWKAGFGAVEVFCARPDQLSKTPNSGESLGKGAFVVRGNLRYFQPDLSLAIGLLPDGRCMGGPPSAVLAHCGKGYQILQGTDKTSDVAKRLGKLFDVSSDTILPLLPAGGVKLGREIRHLGR